ncbi:uncharacterized protein LOC128992101 [Macrosteles quadrilineatus]|uniref:uncharacterized protein LOC128992101 n=1 Tax=Macrosteles quadrilineatus TaxID=74068 RepID=UPI0023E0DA27|nr:uncharacterized protein LOC128992101 [Macrosteles quadrilineatus]XP_054271487.1 uncharacterized protein LOC128992101 [Macrosteles quadrilineatus]
MALVMLPCDLPWWPMLQRHLKHLTTDDCDHVSALQSIHNLCNVGLDPDERDSPDLTVFTMLETFLAEVSETEKAHILGETIPAMARRALDLRSLRPPGGLHFSLQQQQDRIEFDRNFIASLLAHLFFSTFPKRTPKTHPTLQDFNFTNFFKHLDLNFQKAKLRSFFHYFDLLERNGVPSSKIIFSRQVMSGKEWLTIEDWLECGLPLCPLMIRHEGRLDRAPSDHLVVCFTSSRIGGHVLSSGSSWECLQLFQCPEILSALLFCEALEDNEVVTLEGVVQVSRVTDPRYKATLELINAPVTLTSLLMDAENYSKLPLSQYEEDNFLRELNKSLLGFRQRAAPPPPPTTRRLSPIGESFSSTPPENDEAYSKPVQPPQKVKPELGPLATIPPVSIRRRFILLGSSGECLPISRNPASRYSSCHSSDDGDQYFSARTSISETLEEEEEGEHNYSAQLDTPERRCTFAQRLREALDRAQSSESSESSYAVGISVTGSSTGDNDIRMRRGGSRGFMLEEESVDERGRMRRREMREPSRPYKRGNSSRYSFSTEYSSDLEDVYEQLGRWLDEAGDYADGECDRQRLRDVAVVQFAGSLLKRTLSESFVGVPLETGGEQGEPDDSETKQKMKLAMAARSLSLELARHKHKLAAQLVSLVGQRRDCERNLLPVATGNWGCGSSCLGEPQLKVLIQWLTASVAGVPHLLYFTCCHYKLLKLDTVCRVLLDRQWSVGELTGSILRYLQATLDNPNPMDSSTLFEFLIGSEEKPPHDSPPSDTSP